MERRSPRLGAIGFSAGGELAALLSTRSESDAATPVATLDSIDRLSSRPSFQGLIYPALPKVMPLSKDTPPAFLACGANDRPDISEGLPALYLNMKHAGTPVELHIFSGVGHGFGIRTANPSTVSEWPDLFYRWLRTSNFLQTTADSAPK
jgi:acetyl esterase/lipase